MLPANTEPVVDRVPLTRDAVPSVSVRDENIRTLDSVPASIDAVPSESVTPRICAPLTTEPPNVAEPCGDCKLPEEMTAVPSENESDLTITKFVKEPAFKVVVPSVSVVPTTSAATKTRPAVMDDEVAK